MCASARNVTIPTPPHPTPTPPHPMTCVAPTMCASARNMMLRSTDHVCKFKERYHPHPTPPQPHPNFIYINPLGAGVPGEPPAPRVYIYMSNKSFATQCERPRRAPFAGEWLARVARAASCGKANSIFGTKHQTINLYLWKNCRQILESTSVCHERSSNMYDTVEGSEILHHMGCTKPCKTLDKLPINWCRISSINSIVIYRLSSISNFEGLVHQT